MSYGTVKVFTCSIASGATLSGEVDIGHSYFNAFLEIASMTSNSQHFLQGSSSRGGTYRRVKEVPVSATVQSNDWSVASSASSCFVPIPPGLQFLKVETTATADSGQSYNIICGY